MTGRRCSISTRLRTLRDDSRHFDAVARPMLRRSIMLLGYCEGARMLRSAAGRRSACRDRQCQISVSLAPNSAAESDCVAMSETGVPLMSG